MSDTFHKRYARSRRRERCQACAEHYEDAGVCDEGKPVASPHRAYLSIDRKALRECRERAEAQYVARLEVLPWTTPRAIWGDDKLNDALTVLQVLMALPADVGLGRGKRGH